MRPRARGELCRMLAPRLRTRRRMARLMAVGRMAGLSARAAGMATGISIVLIVGRLGGVGMGSVRFRSGSGSGGVRVMWVALLWFNLLREGDVGMGDIGNT
jgi:hypothetical protein